MRKRRLRVLVPLDGSWMAEKALTWVRHLALGTGARLILFRVELSLRVSVFMAQSPDMEKATDSLSEDYMNGMAIPLREEGISIVVELAPAHDLDETVSEARAQIPEGVAQVILARVDESDIDLVIVASHGMTANERVRWGSVCKTILTSARKPVVLVPVRQDMTGMGVGRTENGVSLAVSGADRVGAGRIWRGTVAGATTVSVALWPHVIDAGLARAWSGYFLRDDKLTMAQCTRWTGRRALAIKGL